jgi:hypothetical protein
MTELMKLVPLDEPRPVSADEGALLAALVAPLGLDALSEQVARAEVVSVCSCGCPSVGLRSDGPALAADAVRRLSDVGRHDVLGVSAWGLNDERRAVQVTLHVVSGRLQELEVWAGWDGGEVQTTLPAAESLRPR